MGNAVGVGVLTARGADRVRRVRTIADLAAGADRVEEGTWPRPSASAASGEMSELRVIDHDGPGYPEGLLDLEDPPPLYVLGETTTAPAVAVVGTRHAPGTA